MKPLATYNHDGVKGYSLETLLGIKRDLEINPRVEIKGSWEQTRLAAIKKEIERRMK